MTVLLLEKGLRRPQTGMKAYDFFFFFPTMKLPFLPFEFYTRYIFYLFYISKIRLTNLKKKKYNN